MRDERERERERAGREGTLVRDTESVDARETTETTETTRSTTAKEPLQAKYGRRRRERETVTFNVCDGCKGSR